MSINCNDLFKMSDSTKYFIYASLFLLVSILFCLPAYASSCWLGQSATLSLGTSNAQGSALVSTDVIADCYFNSNQPVTYKLCLVADSFDPAGSTPRSMIIYNPVRALLNYELYSDAARTFKIPDSERKNQAQCQTFQFEAGTGNVSTRLKLYGQVLPGQNVPAAYYQTNSIGLKLYSAYKVGSEVPTDTEALANSNTGNNNLIVNSYYENSCLIQSATDINFGAVDQLKTPLISSGNIQLSCPVGTIMQVSLNNGINAQGTQRRMRNALGNYIRYNLSRNAHDDQPWQGNTFYSVDNHNIPVYATVPAQPISSTGQYSDTITVIITY